MGLTSHRLHCTQALRRNPLGLVASTHAALRWPFNLLSFTRVNTAYQRLERNREMIIYDDLVPMKKNDVKNLYKNWQKKYKAKTKVYSWSIPYRTVHIYDLWKNNHRSE